MIISRPKQVPYAKNTIYIIYIKGESIVSFRKTFILAGVLLGMSIITASVNAANTYTGLVSWYFTQDYSDGQVYTFVNIDAGSICYYIGQNTSYATIFAASQIAGDPVTVSCDSGTYKILQVAN